MMLKTVSQQTQCWCTDGVDMGGLSGSYPSTEGSYAVYDLSPLSMGSRSKTTYGGGLEVISTRLAMGYFKFDCKMPGNFIFHPFPVLT